MVANHAPISLPRRGVTKKIEDESFGGHRAGKDSGLLSDKAQTHKAAVSDSAVKQGRPSQVSVTEHRAPSEVTVTTKHSGAPTTTTRGDQAVHSQSQRQGSWAKIKF